MLLTLSVESVDPLVAQNALARMLLMELKIYLWITISQDVTNPICGISGSVGRSKYVIQDVTRGTQNISGITISQTAQQQTAECLMLAPLVIQHNGGVF